MTRRRLIHLAVLLGALIVAGRWLSARERVAPTSDQPVQLVPSTVTPESLTAIEWSTGPLTEAPRVRLTRDPARGWRVASLQDVPADPERIARVVGQLRGLTGEVRATGPQWAKEFRVGDEDGLRLTVRQGDRVVSDLVINRSPKASWMSFVRPRGRDVIVAVDQNLLGELADVWGEVSTTPPEAKVWVELRLFPAAAATVGSPGAEIRGLELAERARGGWASRAERAAPFDEPAQAVIRDLRAARARDLVDPTHPPAAWAPQWRWRLTQIDGTVLEVEEPAAASSTKTPMPTVTVHRLPDGAYLTVDPSTLSSIRDRLLPPPAPSTPSTKKKSRAATPAAARS